MKSTRCYLNLIIAFIPSSNNSQAFEFFTFKAENGIKAIEIFKEKN